MPYVVGLIAMAMQIDPDLTEEEVFFHLHSTAHEYLDGDFVNPRAFLEPVAAAAGRSLQPFFPKYARPEQTD